MVANIEVDSGQFIEPFPAKPSQFPHCERNDSGNYGHFALPCDDIYAMREKLVARDLLYDAEIS